MKHSKHQEKLINAITAVCFLMQESEPEDMAAAFFSFFAFWESEGLVAEELVDMYRKKSDFLKERLDKELYKKLFGHEKGGLS